MTENEQIKVLLNAALFIAGKFNYGDALAKHQGGYTGPGNLRGLALTEAGALRIVVAHKIEGGEGELLHIYAPGNVVKPGADPTPEVSDIGVTPSVVRRRLDTSAQAALLVWPHDREWHSAAEMFGGRSIGQLSYTLPLLCLTSRAGPDNMQYKLTDMGWLYKLALLGPEKGEK